MKLTRLWMPVLLLWSGISVAGAQSSIRLRFEIYRNGALVGTPEVSVTSGEAGNLAIAGIGRMAFAPTSRGSESVSVAFDIDSSGRRLRPRLVLHVNDPGSVSWTSAAGNESFRFTVAWIR